MPLAVGAYLPALSTASSSASVICWGLYFLMLRRVNRFSIASMIFASLYIICFSYILCPGSGLRQGRGAVQRDAPKTADGALRAGDAHIEPGEAAVEDKEIHSA